MRAIDANPFYLSLQVEDVNLVRDKATGKSRGFCFLKYEDARSCVLAVDNLTGSKVCTSNV
jgi:RNA-binding motif protein, X-linked 2